MAKQPPNAGKRWTPAEMKQLERLATGNTPTRVIGIKLGAPRMPSNRSARGGNLAQANEPIAVRDRSLNHLRSPFNENCPRSNDTTRLDSLIERYKGRTAGKGHAIRPRRG